LQGTLATRENTTAVQCVSLACRGGWSGLHDILDKELTRRPSTGWILLHVTYRVAAQSLPIGTQTARPRRLCQRVESPTSSPFFVQDIRRAKQTLHFSCVLDGGRSNPSATCLAPIPCLVAPRAACCSLPWMPSQALHHFQFYAVWRPSVSLYKHSNLRHKCGTSLSRNNYF
jgi:hypothetical protein